MERKMNIKLDEEVIQYRIAEGLTILPYFASFSIPGLLIGCIFSNSNKSTRYYGYGFRFLATFIAWNCIAAYLCY